MSVEAVFQSKLFYDNDVIFT